MRMWGVDPKLMCRQHLLGEHLEMHMFSGSLRKGKSIKGYIKKGLIEVHNLKNRHEELANELVRRGMSHNSDFILCPEWNEGYVNKEENLKELKRRCSNCCENIELYDRCDNNMELYEAIEIASRNLADEIDNKIMRDILEEGVINE